MNVGGYVFGIFPRSEHLIDTSRSGDGFPEEAGKESELLMQMQKKFGISYIDDPQLVWDDLFRPVVLTQKGFSVNGLTRYFETNTFYKQPVIEKKIEYTGKVEHYLSLRGNPTLIALPDPFTFFCMSKNAWYNDDSVLIKDLGKLLARISNDLKNYGYKLLVLKGPMYAKCNASRLEESIKDSLHEIKDSFSGKVVLHIYFGNPNINASILAGSSIDGVGIDPKFVNQNDMQLYGSKDISLGVVDGLNTRLEKIDELRGLLKGLRRKADNIYITNNVDLEFLPQNFSMNKVKLIGEAVRVLNDEVI
ncbi:MAG: hypothetical protein QXY52_02405 [Conexivisphaerales archaeon]